MNIKKIFKYVAMVTIVATMGFTAYYSQTELYVLQSNLTMENLHALANNEADYNGYKKKITTTTSYEEYVPLDDDYYIYITYIEVDVDCEDYGRIECVKGTYRENYNSEIVYKKGNSIP